MVQTNHGISFFIFEAEREGGERERTERNVLLEANFPVISQLMRHQIQTILHTKAFGLMFVLMKLDEENVTRENKCKSKVTIFKNMFTYH